MVALIRFPFKKKSLKRANFLVFFTSEKTFVGNLHATFSEIFKTNCHEDTKLLNVSYSSEARIQRSKGNNYSENFGEFLKNVMGQQLQSQVSSAKIVKNPKRKGAVRLK